MVGEGVRQGVGWRGRGSLKLTPRCVGIFGFVGHQSVNHWYKSVYRYCFNQPPVYRFYVNEYQHYMNKSVYRYRYFMYESINKYRYYMYEYNKYRYYMYEYNKYRYYMYEYNKYRYYMYEYNKYRYYMYESAYRYLMYESVYRYRYYMYESAYRYLMYESVYRYRYYMYKSAYRYRYSMYESAYRFTYYIYESAYRYKYYMYESVYRHYMYESVYRYYMYESVYRHYMYESVYRHYMYESVYRHYMYESVYRHYMYESVYRHYMYESVYRHYMYESVYRHYIVELAGLLQDLVHMVFAYTFVEKQGETGKHEEWIPIAKLVRCRQLLELKQSNFLLINSLLTIVNSLLTVTDVVLLFGFIGPGCDGVVHTKMMCLCCLGVEKPSLKRIPMNHCHCQNPNCDFSSADWEERYEAELTELLISWPLSDGRDMGGLINVAVLGEAIPVFGEWAVNPELSFTIVDSLLLASRVCKGEFFLRGIGRQRAPHHLQHVKGILKGELTFEFKKQPPVAEEQ
ncbi:hypothetical protein MAR_011001, partial [Mya arenaria]